MTGPAGGAIVAVVLACLVGAASAREAAWTPRPGSAERKAIVEAVKADIRGYHGLETVLYVNHLKVQGDWAWIETDPRSPDGQSQYEPVNALLRQSNGHWRVVEMPCTGEEPECIGQPGYVDGLRGRFPGMPMEILD